MGQWVCQSVSSRWRLFVCLSNELTRPVVLKCPRDPERRRATNFARLSITNLSYFLSLDTSETNPTSILIGDRNLRINWRATNGFVEITNPQIVTWGNGIHGGYGHVAMTDGSAHLTSDLLLQKDLQDSRLGTNRFAIP